MHLEPKELLKYTLTNLFYILYKIIVLLLPKEAMFQCFLYEAYKDIHCSLLTCIFDVISYDLDSVI